MPFSCTSSLEYSLHADKFSSCNLQVMNASKLVIPSWRPINPHFFLCFDKVLYNADQNAAKIFVFG